MTGYGTAVLVTNGITYLCYAAGLFLLSEHKNGILKSILRLAVFWLCIMGFCIFAVLNRWRAFYYFINFFELFMMVLFLVVDSSGYFFKKLFLAIALGLFILVTFIPCEFVLERVSTPISYFLYSTIRITMVSCLGVYWVKKGRLSFEKATERITGKRWGLLCIFSVTAELAAIFTISRLLMLNPDNSIWDYTVSLCLLLTIAAAYIIIIKMIRFLNEENETRALKAQEAVLRGELEAEQKFIELSRQNRHDLRHHTRLLLDLLEKNDVEAVKNYLTQYEKSLEEDALLQFCENIVANAMLRRADALCKARGISFSCSANIPASLPVSDTDSVILFGNLLENAVEACLAAKGATDSASVSSPALCVSAKVTGGKFCLSVRNSVSSAVTFKDEVPVSTKKNGGIGIRSMARVLEKCGGMMTFAQEGGEFVTQVIVPL